MKKTLKMYLGENRLRTVAHRCDKILSSGLVKTRYGWGGTSTSKTIETWKEFIQNFIKVYQQEYSAGFHQLVAVATLLAQSEIYGVHYLLCTDEFMFSCNLNSPCQMGKACNFDQIPLVKIETEETINRALSCSAFRTNFILKVKICDEPDGDPRTARDIRIVKIAFRL